MGGFFWGLIMLGVMVFDEELGSIVFEVVGFDGGEPVEKPDKNFKRIIGLKNPKV